MAVNAANNIPDNNIAPNSEILLHELQLGEQLNESVHQARRADFSLMLAMLCDDVREHSQFILPQSDVSDESKQTTQSLRKHFDLPEQAPLALKNIEQISQYNQSQLIADNDFVSIKLSNALSPKPLTFRDDNHHIASNVLGNTSLTCQEKHTHQQSSKVLNKRVKMNVEGWLKTVQTALVKSTLVNAITA
ncbi:VC2046/SO_2500 family protein [Candidatus Colwellia aromaticivorans]|uniref:VC2046/SO_2500 family protein n=1 Tax=Candidatus Colwellia aromaticivorans TaxID=2267621 RepID=UPI001FEB4892|nr:VC2046/SO_2500 family protein [Candidatus Colwellia aromaticivorans]